MRYTWDIFSTGTSYVGTPRILGRNYSNLRSALRISIFFLEDICKGVAL